MQLSERLVTPDSPLIANIKRKQQLLAHSDPSHKTIKTALIIGPGAMRGVYSGGVVTALEELGLTEAFDEVIGISAGAATLAYFLSGQAKFGTSIYYEELTDPAFINHKRPNNLLNITMLEDIFAKHKPLQQAKIHASRSNFYIGVTNVETAEPEYVKVNRAPDTDIVRLIQASSAVPGMAAPVEVEGILYNDGIATCKNPIGFAIDTLGCTDVLWVINQPLRPRESLSTTEKITSRLATRKYSKDYRAAFLERHLQSDQSATTVYETVANIGVLCPPKTPINYLSRNAKRLQQIAIQAERQTHALFVQ